MALVSEKARRTPHAHYLPLECSATLSHTICRIARFWPLWHSTPLRSAKGVSDGLSAADCELFRRVRLGSHMRASLWCGVGMTDDERTSVQAQTGKEAAVAYEAERDAAVAAAQKRLLGGN